MIFEALLALGASILVAGGDGSKSISKIDGLLQDLHRRTRIQPSPTTSDLQFLRRVSLDLIGRIPTSDEIDAFQRNPNRAELVDSLLQSKRFDRFLSEVWTGWLLGYSNAFQTDRELFRSWLEDQIARGVSFRQIVASIIMATGSVAIDGPTNFLARHYQQPVVAVCRSFLGVRIECAQCHDHPFDRWTQQDYQQMARFFEPLRRGERSGAFTLYDRVPNTAGRRPPQFLTGATPKTGRYREELALYLTHCQPFARNYANRCWYHLLGQGIVDPPDDHNQENLPVDRALLDYLTQRSIELDFDIKPIFREICLTDAYQRVSRSDAPQAIEVFAVRRIKPLLPEQFVDSLSVALNRPFDPPQRRQFILQLAGGPSALDEDFQRTWDYRETVPMLLRKMNLEIQERKVESLEDIYLRFLTRRPTPREVAICRKQAGGDVIFALAFGNEFYFNQ